jgi:hypothetical protein
MISCLGRAVNRQPANVAFWYAEVISSAKGHMSLVRLGPRGEPTDRRFRVLHAVASARCFVVRRQLPLLPEIRRALLIGSCVWRSLRGLMIAEPIDPVT